MSHETPVQPKLNDLMSRYLQRQTQAHADGVAQFDPGAEVTPFESGPVQPIDARLAWEESKHVAQWLSIPSLTIPHGWATLVAQHEPVVALTCSLGNFPQLVRNFHQILQGADLRKLQPQPGRPVVIPGLDDWLKDVGGANQLLALGTLRLAKQFADADRWIATHDAGIAESMRAAWENEKASLAWHRGQTAEAVAIWKQQPESLPIHFNRGMAELFVGKRDDARVSLDTFIAQVPEMSAWHHLARLYRTLAG